MKRTAFVGLAAALLLILGGAYAETLPAVCRIGDVSGTEIRPVEVNGAQYIFLPSCAYTEPLTISASTDYGMTITAPGGQTMPVASGVPFLLPGCTTGNPDGSEYTLTVQRGGTAERVTVLLSANLPALFLKSDDPVRQGRVWLEDCINHERSTTGTAVMLRADGSAVYDGSLMEIRGRGNSTWSVAVADASSREGDQKRPYQIKLKNAADLLDTGDPREANKRWVLLADFFDGTLLRNRIALDLALELGMNETSRHQPVDLYYDGEYRGRYLLAEKVEVGDGRVEIADYEELLENWNASLDEAPETFLPVVSTNRYGDAVYATDVWDAGETALGGYLVELDRAYGAETPAYFTLQNGLVFSVRNPQYASASMVRYVSELLEDAGAAVRNGGISPETGATWTDYFDLDTLLPFFWVNEWSKNEEAWNNSSTFFTLPAQSRTFRMGPVWDFDLAFYTRSYTDGSVSDPTGLIETAAREGFSYGLLHVPAFRTLAAQYYLDVLEPLVARVLLGGRDARGNTLRSLTWYWEQEAASRRMNDVLWNPASALERFASSDYEENFEALRGFIAQRTAWLTKETARWQNPVMLDTIRLSLTACYANVKGTLKTAPKESDGSLFVFDDTLTLEQEATESAYAVWRADLSVFMEIGYFLADGAALFLNGTEVPYRKNADGSVSVTVWFEDPSYQPAVFHGVDYGLVFDAGYYAAHNPLIAAAVGNDRGALLRWYVTNGIPDGQAANEFFKPREIQEKLPDVEMMLGERFEDVVLFFLEAGYRDWMGRMGKTFEPQIRTAPGGF